MQNTDNHYLKDMKIDNHYEHATCSILNSQLRMIHNKIHISPGCPRPSRALQVQNRGQNPIH